MDLIFQDFYFTEQFLALLKEPPKEKENLQSQNYANVINKKDSKSDPLGNNCSTNKNDEVSRFFNCPVFLIAAHSIEGGLYSKHQARNNL